MSEDPLMAKALAADLVSQTIPAKDPNVPFDFEWEATVAAVNEACAGRIEDCGWANLCPECRTLQRAIKLRLMRAFLAGKREGQK